MLNRVMDYVRAEEKLTVEIRRELHSHPELSGQEHNTIEYIRNKLEEWAEAFSDE